MKASICLLLGVAVFSTLFLESSTASTGNYGLLGGVIGGVGDLTGNLLEAVKKVLAQVLGTVTKNVDRAIWIVTNLLNETGTVVTNTTGETKDVVTEIQTIANNLLDTLAQIVPAIASGTSESMDKALAVVASAEGPIKNLFDIVTANPEAAGSLKTLGAVLEIVPRLLELINESIIQAKVQISV